MIEPSTYSVGSVLKLPTPPRPWEIWSDILVFGLWADVVSWWWCEQGAWVSWKGGICGVEVVDSGVIGVLKGSEVVA